MPAQDILEQTKRSLARIAAALAALSVAGCGGGVQGSCASMWNNTNRCTEYADYPREHITTQTASCGALEGGSWSGGACNRAGSIGSCRRVQIAGLTTTIYYAGNASELSQECTAQNGTWAATR